MLNARLPSLKDKLRAEEEARLEKLEQKTKEVEVKVKKVKKTARNKN